MVKMISPTTRTISICMRGYGYSTYNTPIECIKDLADDLELFIKEHLKVGKVYLIGHSFGAITAWKLSTMIPDMLLGIIMISTRIITMAAAPNSNYP